MVEKESGFGLGTGTEEVCGLQGSHQRHIWSKKDETPMCMPQPAIRQADKCLHLAGAALGGAATAGRTSVPGGRRGGHPPLGQLCPDWQDSGWTNKADDRVDQQKRYLKAFWMCTMTSQYMCNKY